MPIKNTIKNILKELRPTPGEYGVEIEVEGMALPRDVSPKYWRVDKDGSLKSGYEAYEYVTPLPGDLVYIRSALDDLEKAYQRNISQVIETMLAGIHVHINVQDWTPKQVFTFATLYYIFDELLVDWCGDTRVGNHFCLRGKDAEYLIHQLIDAAQSKKFGGLKTDNIRYSSLNFCSLFKYGSLELRSMRSTRDLDAVMEWVLLLDKLKQSAFEFDNPIDVVSAMSVQGELTFIKTIFGDEANPLLKIKDCEKKVRDGVRLIQPLAFSTDWDDYKNTITNPFPKEALNEIR